MRCNVDLLKIIQIGLTLSDEDGNYPQEVSTWQFNFHFSIECVCFFSRGISGSLLDPLLMLLQRGHVCAGIRGTSAKIGYRL